jgi:hypothetical protein
LDSSDDDANAGKRFFESLEDADFAGCEYHQGVDWLAIVRTSVRLFRRLKELPVSQLDAAIIAARLPEAELWWLASLFRQPIVWRKHSPQVIDGQHRICAVRASGARLCVIDHDLFAPYG